MKIIKRRNYSIFGFNAENFMKIRQGMTSGECVENKWFNMKYIGKYLSVEILLTHACTRLRVQTDLPSCWCCIQ